MPPRLSVALISWNDDVASKHKRLLESVGIRVVLVISRGSGAIGKIRKAAPSTIVIDLDAKPAYGREIAIIFRNSPSTRNIPLVFTGGAEEKVLLVRAELPDAVYCRWEAVRSGIEKALTQQPTRPVRPRRRGEAIVHGSVLARKFDIKPDLPVVAILGDFIGLGDRLSVAYEERISAQTQLALFVVRTAYELDAAFECAAAQLPRSASFWIIYPKQSGTLRTDFNQKDIVELAREYKFSAYKTCAVDEDWSAQKLTRRK
jgi:CheY-like chemotaxis protein